MRTKLHHWDFCCYGLNKCVCVCVRVYVRVCSLRTSVKNGLFTSHEDEVFHRGIVTLVSLPEPAMNLTPNLTSLLLLIMVVLCSINHRLSFSLPLALFRAVRFTKKHMRNQRSYRGLHRETASTTARTGGSGQAALQLLLVAFTARQHRPT